MPARTILRRKRMDEARFYRAVALYEILLNVFLWVIYDPGRSYFGVYAWIGIVLFLLVGVPALAYGVMTVQPGLRKRPGVE